MDFGANKTPVEIIKEGAFGGTSFRDIYSGVNDKWYRESWKEFNFCSNSYNSSINKCAVKCGTS